MCTPCGYYCVRDTNHQPFKATNTIVCVKAKVSVMSNTSSQKVGMCIWRLHTLLFFFFWFETQNSNSNARTPTFRQRNFENNYKITAIITLKYRKAKRSQWFEFNYKINYSHYFLMCRRYLKHSWNSRYEYVTAKGDEFVMWFLPWSCSLETADGLSNHLLVRHYRF